MKTREEIYGKEAAGLLRDITTYHCIHREQLLKLYPIKESKIDNLLHHLVRQGRIFFNEANGCYYDAEDFETDAEMLAALWVLADFADRVEYHSTDEFPVKLIFFADGEVYEVVCISEDKQVLIEHALLQADKSDQDEGKRILIVSSIEQIKRIGVPDAVFCLVDMESGQVQYFLREEV